MIFILLLLLFMFYKCKKNVMYNNNKKNVQIKVVGTGSTNCQILSSFTLYESPVQGLSRHIALLGGFPYRKNDIKIKR